MPPPPKRGRPGSGEFLTERSRGALLGLAVGDALGTTNEFKNIVAAPFPQLTQGTHVDMLGGGPFRVKPGQVTDDTQMACCLAESLRELRAFDPEDLGRRYVEWMRWAFDIGELTQAVLEDIRAKRFPLLAGKHRWQATGRTAAGNGSLMRTAPIGVFFARPAHAQARLEASLGDSALTHFDPRCQLACAALNAAIAFCLNGPEELDLGRLFEATNIELAKAAALLGRREPEFVRETQAALSQLRSDLDFARQPDPQLYGPELHLYQMKGYVRVAFRLAFWELVHAPSYEEALIDVVNRGGDADTNGAIAGALLGAFHGERTIPERWSTIVLEALPGNFTPLGTKYHPRELLTLQPR